MEKKTQKRTIECRQKLLTAAETLFREKGYFNTNTKEIAAKAEVSVGNFYNYYHDKFDIYFELTRNYMEGSVKAVQTLKERLINEKDMRSTIINYVNDQMYRATLTGRMFSDCQVLIQDNPTLQELNDTTAKVFVGALEELLRETPSIKVRGSYPVMARFLFTMTDRVSEDVASSRADGIYEEYKRQLAEAILLYLFGESSNK